jgi:hypothetical protein
MRNAAHLDDELFNQLLRDNNISQEEYSQWHTALASENPFHSMKIRGRQDMRRQHV